VNSSNRRQGGSTTALKAFRALEAVAGSREKVTARYVGEQLGIDKVSAYRMLVTLEQAGYVTRDEASKKYGLSYKVISLSRNLLAENEVSRMVQDFMREVSAETLETLHYSVLDGFEAVLVYRVKGTQLVNVDFQIGDRSPLHCTAIGKAMLAYQDQDFFRRFMETEPQPRTAETLTDPDELHAELERIRARGFAIDDKEFAENLRCVAVPVFGAGGHVTSGLAISGPDSRFSRSYLMKLKDPMLRAAEELSRRFGGID